MSEECMTAMAKSMCNQNQPSPTQLELRRLFFSIYLSVENW